MSPDHPGQRPPGPSAGGSSGQDPEEPHSPRGADMARAALEAARARNASARRSGKAKAGASAEEVRRLRRRRWSGPGEDRARDPQAIGSMIKNWVARNDAGTEVTKARLFAHWTEIVGSDIAAHAEPTSLVDGELTVQAESTAWATQLRLLAPGIVRSINTALGHGTVQRIRTKGPTAPSWRFGSRHISGRGPRDTYG